MRVVVLLVCLGLLQAVSARDWFESFGTLLRGFGSQPKSSSPWFCHDLDCPPYKVIEQFDDIELRRYSEGLWVSTTVEEARYEVAITKGFMRLFKYISGDNVDGSKVEMTAPVRTKIYPSQGPFCSNNFTISFFVPFDYQAKGPPAPKSADVFIEKSPQLDVYVSSFPGFASEKDILGQARGLVQKLDAAGKRYQSSHYFSAGYDSPFRLVGRHNEVWIVAEAKEEGGSSSRL